MDLKKLEDSLKEAVVMKQEGLVFSVSLDGKKVIKDVIEEALKEMVADSSNPYDDKLLAIALPFVDKYLDGQ
jgi:Ribonuclease G/E